MQAVILAAGASTRFFPYNLKHKSLIEIAGEPIIVHTIRSIKRAGITDIVLAVPNKNDFQDILGDGKKYGVKIKYVIDSDPNGSGETILKAAHLINSDFFLLHGNRIEFDLLKKELDKARDTNQNVVLLAKEYSNNSQYGVLRVDKNIVLEVVEKAKDPDKISKLRVLGLYFMTQDFLKTLKKEKKHHYSLESAINTYAGFGKVRFAVTTADYTTLKYPWDILEVKNYILSKFTRKISKKANVSKNALIEGNVVIEEGATISENATIKGPVYIGKNTFVGSNSLIRNSSTVEENGVVGGYMEVKNTIISRDSKTHSGHIEDSILGENSRIGALFTSANVRLDRKNVVSHVKQDEVDTGFRALGVLIGSNTHLGARVTTMPGVIIGNSSNIGPSTTVMKNIESNTSYYTKFAEIVEKKKIIKST